MHITRVMGNISRIKAFFVNLQDNEGEGTKGGARI